MIIDAYALLRHCYREGAAVECDAEVAAATTALGKVARNSQAYIKENTDR
jgi:hypothetical protein